MKLNLGIAGYGNLGKSLKNHIEKDEACNLVAVFSRRNLPNENCVPFVDLPLYRKKIDVLLLALGSHCDIANHINDVAAYDTVDSYDTHANIAAYKQLLELNKPNTMSVCCTGWDPGLLSCIRGLYSAAGANIATFWGKGISQGHSNALRTIDGVADAVEITIPLCDAQRAFAEGKNVADNQRHKRMCYVCCKEEDRRRIADEICNMPHYFEGQKLAVKFCSQEEIDQIKSNTQHSGQVLAYGDGFAAETHVTLQCNTDFTAKIMLAYAKAVPQLKKNGYSGALDPFDIPLKYIADKSLI